MLTFVRQLTNRPHIFKLSFVFQTLISIYLDSNDVFILITMGELKLRYPQVRGCVCAADVADIH